MHRVLQRLLPKKGWVRAGVGATDWSALTVPLSCTQLLLRVNKLNWRRGFKEILGTEIGLTGSISLVSMGAKLTCLVDHGITSAVESTYASNKVRWQIDNGWSLIRQESPQSFIQCGLHRRRWRVQQRRVGVRRALHKWNIRDRGAWSLQKTSSIRLSQPSKQTWEIWVIIWCWWPQQWLLLPGASRFLQTKAEKAKERGK